MITTVENSRKISLASADIPFRAMLNVWDCLKSERIGRGKYVNLLEIRAAEYFGVKHAIAVANGTLADYVMLATLKQMYPGKDEVILPALTFVAQANAVLLAGLKPIFVDVGLDFQMDIEATKKAITHKTLCVFPVHLLGKEAHVVSELMRPDVPVIEDCCEAMGGRYRRVNTNYRFFGTRGMAGAFSMYPSHTITTGEGGLIITNNDEFARIARSIHNHGKADKDFDFLFPGINAKMTNLQAAIGAELIGKIEEVNQIRRNNVRIYNYLLDQIFYADAPHCYPVIFTSKAQRDAALKALAENGIEARKLMGCIPDYPFYKDYYWECHNARKFADRGLFVPIHQRLTDKDIKFVSKILTDLIG